VRVGSWVGAEEAKREIIESVERYRAASPKPKF
jgi:inorganic pyrophosphatase